MTLRLAVSNHDTAQIQIGHRARTVGDLRGGIVVCYAGLAWTMTDAYHNPDDATVALKMTHVEIPGTEWTKPGGKGRLDLPGWDHPPATIDGVALPDGSWGWKFNRWVRLDLAAHHAVCGTCRLLWPCPHQAEADDVERQQEDARHAKPCRHCGKDMGAGMIIEFPSATRERVIAGVTLRLVTDDDTPAAMPARPDVEARSVWFHGKRGPCENAAYRYAAANGWDLPPKDGSRSRRWWVTAKKRGDQQRLEI